MQQEKIDYRTEHLLMPLENDDIIGYASINSIMYRDEGGLDITGRYFVYLLHPTMGSTQFELEPTSAQTMPWKKVGGAVWLDKELVQKIVDQIELKRKTGEKQ